MLRGRAYKTKPIGINKAKFSFLKEINAQTSVLSWSNAVPLSQRLLLVQCLDGACAWVAGAVPGQGGHERQPIKVSLLFGFFSPSLSPSLLLSLKINEIFEEINEIEKSFGKINEKRRKAHEIIICNEKVHSYKMEINLKFEEIDIFLKVYNF